jgi:hypothetical protein
MSKTLIPEVPEKALTQQELARRIPACPTAGNGVHRYLWRAARMLWDLCDDEALITRILTDATANCGRRVEPVEIEDAVRNSSPDNYSEPFGKSSWPKLDERRIAYIARDGSALERLGKSSPENPEAKTSDEWVDLLFPADDPLLCFGLDQRRFTTHRRSELSGLNRFQFMVPSRMISEFGTTRSEKQSPRCLANTGPRDYLVVEFDSGTENEQAAKFLHLAEFAPLAMVLHSGGKSGHGWFACHGNSEDDLRDFMAYAVSLGADPATWSRCQLVRVPAATRDNGKIQRVLYFNREVISL